MVIVNSTHDGKLFELMYHLEEVDEKPEDIECVLHDAIWTPEYKDGMEKMCDLILLYRPNELFDGEYGVPIELKGSRKKRRKAMKQILCGKDLINNVFDRPVPYGKLVIYRRRDYIYENIDFDDI